MTPNSPSALVSFVPESAIRGRVASAFALHLRQLSESLPAARIEHVGSTAVPGSLTKGDLDIQVCVSIESFAAADAVLADSYARNLASPHTPTFSSFMDEDADPPLGIQLTAAGGLEDFFSRLRDHLISHPVVNERYNQLKRELEGATMTDYRAAKSDFLEALLAQIRAGDASRGTRSNQRV